jgi:hypothetical protein
MNSVGSLLNPLSSEQLIAFYQHHQHSAKEKQSEFLETYKRIQHVAIKDSKELQGLGTTFAEVSNKLSTIIEKATQAYSSNVDPTPVVKIDGGEFRVDGLDPFEHSFSAEPCSLCNHTVTGGVKYRIQNLKSQEEILCHGLTLHYIEKHSFFLTPTSRYRLEPSRVSQVIEAQKT